MNPIIERINQLAKKAKTIGLSEKELKERQILRQEYVKQFREKFKNKIIDNIYILEKDGSKTKLTDNK